MTTVVAAPDSIEMARLRWRCRRGLLELDIVLGRFVERGYAVLDEAQKIEFNVLLDLPDTVLWDKIGGKAPAEHEAQKKILKLINAA
jgi:antitoxin CptB